MRNLLWPIHRYELKKFLPFLMMFFLVSFGYSVLRTMKDTLVVTVHGFKGSGFRGSNFTANLNRWYVKPELWLWLRAEKANFWPSRLTHSQNSGTIQLFSGNIKCNSAISHIFFCSGSYHSLSFSIFMPLWKKKAIWKNFVVRTCWQNLFLQYGAEDKNWRLFF